MALVLNGSSLANEIIESLKGDVDKIKLEVARSPKLGIVMVGEVSYEDSRLMNKISFCESVGIETKIINASEDKHFEKDVFEEDDSIDESPLKWSLERRFEEAIFRFNEDKNIDGIICHFGKPKIENARKIINCINPKKDVEGRHPFNYGKIALGLKGHIAPKALGVVKLLKHHHIPTSGAHCVILGGGKFLGRTLSILLSKDKYPGNCTTTLCNSYTENIDDLTLQADILISATNKAKSLTSSMIKEGCVVIDAGISEDKSEGYGISGDVDVSSVFEKCGAITDSYKCTEEMSLAMLARNTIKSASYKFEGF